VKPKICSDFIRISSADHSGSLLADICVERQRYFLNEYSSANPIYIQFVSSNFAPHRGFILEYKVTGCATLAAPVNGFLSSRNSTCATYRCKSDYYFKETLTSHRTIHCVNNTRWNTQPGHCLSRYELAYSGHLYLEGDSGEKPSTVLSNSIEGPVKSLPGFELDDIDDSDLPLAITSPRHRPSSASSSLFSRSFSSFAKTMSQYADVIVPAIIVAALLVGNVLVILIIYKLRRQNKQRISQRTPVELPLDDRDERKAPLATI